MNAKLKELANKVIKDIPTQDEYEFFMTFAEKYGMLIINECIDAVNKNEYPNAYGEITGVKAICDRFNMEI